MLRRTVPAHIAEAVERYDHSLRLRWSQERGKYVLERKVPHHLRRLLDVPLQRINVKGEWRDIPLPDGADKKIRWEDGYCLILESSVADARLLSQIYHGDMYRQGIKAYLRKVNALEEKCRQQKEAVETEGNKETFEKMWHYLKNPNAANLAA